MDSSGNSARAEDTLRLNRAEDVVVLTIERPRVKSALDVRTIEALAEAAHLFEAASRAWTGSAPGPTNVERREGPGRARRGRRPE